jgi:hypothetical protein
MKRLFGFLIAVSLVITGVAPANSAIDAPYLMVGRVYHVEGSLLRYVKAENDWVAVVRDAPLSAGDTFYTGRDGVAELIVPNGTWVRIADNTQIQFIGLDSDTSEIDMAAGGGRFINKDADLMMKVTSPFGYVLVYPGSIFDFYVGENSAEVVPIKGRITFVHTESNARYEVYPGNPSILADFYRVSSGEGGVDQEWDEWNRYRDSFWASKNRSTGSSVQYLPAALRHDAYVFEENGRWERVYYEGSDRWFWRPTRVSPDWAPFTVGRWTEWHGDQTWIPSEQFGYVTHHYGNWIFVGGRWYWAPPVTHVTTGLPLLNVGFFWYPGRVSWIYSGGYIGWVPLAPRETYYSHNYWGGPHVVKVTNINITQINIYPQNYAYAGHAVVVPQRSLYTVNNYRPVRVTNINNTTIINNYRAAPVVNNTVIKDYSSTRQRYNFADIHVKEKPHKTVVEKIEANQKMIGKGKIEKASVMDQQVKSIREGKIDREAKIQKPKVTSYIVPANEMNRPKSEMKLEQREFKKRAGRETRDESGESLKPSAKPERQPGRQDLQPVKPEPPNARQGASAVRPDRQAGKPNKGDAEQQGRPSLKPERVVVPEKPASLSPSTESLAPNKPVPRVERQIPDKPAPRTDESLSARPGRPGQKVERLENENNGSSSMKPDKANSVKHGRPPVKPEGVAPEKAEKPAEKTEGVKPARPRPNGTPEDVVPPKPVSKTEGTKVWL